MKKRSQLKTFLKYFLILIFVLATVLCGYFFFLHRAYPTTYKELVETYSEEYNVPPELIFAVIKTESKFKKNALSNSGAIGLMQIMPETFSWLQTHISDKALDEEKLKDPKINIKYGTYFLSYLKKKYKDEKVQLSAYNAGIGTVEKWLKNKEYSSDGKTLKKIPYKETENYVGEVLKSLEKYKKLYYNNWLFFTFCLL